jgi:hypothetical protein
METTMKKLIIAAAVAALTLGSMSFADTLDTSASSNAGQESTTLGGAGSVGNGAALSGSSVDSKQYSAGIGLAGSAGAGCCGIAGSATSTVSTGKVTAVNGAISAGQAGGFSGSATGGGSSATAKAKAKSKYGS